MLSPNVPPCRPVPVPEKVSIPPLDDSDDGDSVNKALIVVAIVLGFFLLTLLLLLLVPANAPTGSGSGRGKAGVGAGIGEQTDDGKGKNGPSDDGNNDEAETVSENGSKKSPTDHQTSDDSTTKAGDDHIPEQTNTTPGGDSREPQPSPEESIIDEQDPIPPENPPSSSSNKSGSGSGITLRVFGVGGYGTKFMYVFDRSLSMRGAKLDEVKKELLKSFSALDERHQFNIIFYDDRYDVWKPGGKLIVADESAKKDAEEFVQKITHRGLTQHLPPLLEAIKYGPNVIFFLTDGQDLTETQLDEVCRKSGNICIHVIQFADESDQEQSEILRRLASRNRGRYKFINVTTMDSL